MRNLTIKRKSAAAGRFAKMNVYVADASSNEIVLNGVACRKIGTLKNGDVTTFCVTEDATDIFVMCDQEGRNGFVGVFHLEAGTNDVVLSGKTKLVNHGQFAFVFDSQQNGYNPSSSKKRVVFKRWLVRVLIMFVCVGLLRSYYHTEPKTFTKSGFTITLTDAFEEKEDEESLAKYSSRKAILFVDKIMAYTDDQLKHLTTREFAERIIENSGFDATVTTNSNGLVMFIIEDHSDSTTSFVYIYRTVDAFWKAEFLVRSRHADSYRDQIDQWANSVEIYK